jgi:hypothetical protein
MRPGIDFDATRRVANTPLNQLNAYCTLMLPGPTYILSNGMSPVPIRALMPTQKFPANYETANPLRRHKKMPPGK